MGIKVGSFENKEKKIPDEFKNLAKDFAEYEATKIELNTLKNEKEKDLIKSLFVVELEESNAADFQKEEASEGDLLRFFDFMMASNNDGYTKLVQQDFVKKK